MPEEWKRLGLQHRTSELRSNRRQQEDVLVSSYALTQENEARIAFERLIDSVLKHAWPRYPKLLSLASEVLTVEDAKDQFREAVGLIDAESHIQDVKQHLSQDAVYRISKDIALKRAEAQAIREIFFKGREKNLVDIMQERKTAGTLETYVDNLKRQGAWGGVLSFSFLWPNKSIKPVRERAAACFEKKRGIESAIGAALKEQCHKLRHTRGMWDDSIQRKCKERQKTLGMEAKVLDREIKKGLHQLARMLIQSSGDYHEHHKMGRQTLAFKKIEMLEKGKTPAMREKAAGVIEEKEGDKSIMTAAEYKVQYEITELEVEVGLELLARRLLAPSLEPVLA